MMDLLRGISEWFADAGNWQGSEGIPLRLLQHLWLTLVPMVIATAFTLPPALFLAHRRSGEFVASALVNIGRAVPSFGVIMVAFLFFVRIGASFEFWPLVVALVVLAVPPIFTNSYAAISGVNPALVEAARGMGLSERQVLFRVEMPIGSAVLLAGVRIALIQVMATVPIGAIVSNGGGLGRYIVDGFARGPAGRAEVAAGALLVAGLTLLTDWAFGQAERAVLPTGVRRVAAAEAKATYTAA